MQVPAPTEMDLAHGYTGQATLCDNALLVPFGETRDQVCHVTDPSTGRMVHRHRDPCDLPLDDYGARVAEAPAKHMAGTYILGGYLSAHLGHFLTGTLAPLWALDHHDGPVDAVLCFRIVANTPEKNRKDEAAASSFLKQLGIDLPIVTVTEPTRVDHLILAEHGIGSYRRARGSSYYHRFLRNRNALSTSDLAQQDRPKIYITRSQLSPTRRGIVGEEALEKTFAAAGYEVYSPEKFPLSEQIALYQKAKAIVALDGTPFHLIPSVCPADAQIAIVSRRGNEDDPSVDFAGQIEAAIGAAPLQINRIVGEWRQNSDAPNKLPLAVLDFEETYRDFVAGGFLDRDAQKSYPSDDEIDAQLLAASAKVGVAFSFHDFRAAPIDPVPPAGMDKVPTPKPTAADAPAPRPGKPATLDEQVGTLRGQIETLQSERDADRAYFAEQIEQLRQQVERGHGPGKRGLWARLFG